MLSSVSRLKSRKLGLHRPRTKFLDVEKAKLAYRKQRKHTKSQTRKITHRLLDLLGKMLKEMRQQTGKVTAQLKTKTLNDNP